MHGEQAFGELVDIEHLFVLQCKESEHVFEGGAAMSVALELEYDAFYPGLRLVSEQPGRVERGAPERRRWVVPAVMAVVVLLVLLVLPIRALGGTTVNPSAGREYVVRSGDTLASIAARVGGRNVAGLERQLADEAGSTVLVPGEHLLIP
jgi:hypothetical protein